ncbi:glycosyltransferase [Bacillus sp. JCM 19046]|nr:glycosyltransferase, group 1 [Bacillus sp. JCM 19045]GAF17442.1 glycosyltransferase [Bacillus sp. JCM 19046]
MSKTICFLVAEHPFLDARIFQKEAKSLVRRGYNVSMIVPRREGFLFDIDGSLLTDCFLETSFMHEGVRIIAYDPPGAKRQIARQLYYAKSGKLDPLPSPLTTLGVELQADLYHAHEFSSCYDALMIKRVLNQRKQRTRIIYDSHELVPDALEKMSRITRVKMAELLEQMFKELDTVITVSSSIKQDYEQIDSAVPIEVLFNSPLLSPFEQKNKGDHSPLVLGYVGRMDEDKGSLARLIQIVEYANRFINLRVKVIGGLAEPARNRVPEHIRKKIDWVGWVPYEKLAEELRDIDIGWIDIKTENSLNRMYSMPNKFFSYLERGIPPLVNRGKDMKAFIGEYQCGFVLEENASPVDFAKALIRLNEDRAQITETGLRARKVMEERYVWEKMEQHLYEIYERLLSEPAKR